MSRNSKCPKEIKKIVKNKQISKKKDKILFQNVDETVILMLK